ncbi:hypothetical protein SADUNF_Sadunf13G0065900 [Salix dunnii]|uniref:Uncharacterized protein n=1 Tax=Salix dunnii TaxID=1413687 RepID=A0A835MLV0_9ROSI|nr:hypothetical protein SADUNF_Sadunf13G0065900 [Salix dunnii]
MVKLRPHQSLSIISFDYFEPVKLDVILHLSSLYPQLKLHMKPFHLKLVETFDESLYRLEMRIFQLKPQESLLH